MYLYIGVCIYALFTSTHFEMSLVQAMQTTFFISTHPLSLVSIWTFVPFVARFSFHCPFWFSSSDVRFFLFVALRSFLLLSLPVVALSGFHCS